MGIDHLLNRTLLVSRQLAGDDGGGGQTSAWVPVGAIRGRLSQPTAVERDRAAQSGADLTHIVYAAAGADVRRGDRLAVDAGGGGGLLLEVLATFGPSEPIYLRADCRERQAEEPL